MPDTQLFTAQAAARKANVIKTSLALAVLHLIKAPFTMTAFSTKAEMEAAEADFDGYDPEDGYPLTAFTGPTSDPSGGAVLTSPLVNVIYGPAGDPPVGNLIAGWWIEDATSEVRLSGTFDPPRSVAAALEGFPLVVQIVEGRNPTIV